MRAVQRPRGVGRALADVEGDIRGEEEVVDGEEMGSDVDENDEETSFLGPLTTSEPFGIV